MNGPLLLDIEPRRSSPQILLRIFVQILKNAFHFAHLLVVEVYLLLEVLEQLSHTLYNIVLRRRLALLTLRSKLFTYEVGETC